MCRAYQLSSLAMTAVIRVSLTHAEEVTAHEIGFLRAKELGSVADHASRYDKHLNYHEYIGQLAEAVGSEIAVSKYFAITNFSPTHSTFKTEADVGSRIEVKWTKYADGHLVVHQSDRASDIAVLVCGRSPNYILAGWIPVAAARFKRYYHPRDKNWWVTQRDLRPMENFLESEYADALV